MHSVDGLEYEGRADFRQRLHFLVYAVAFHDVLQQALPFLFLAPVLCFCWMPTVQELFKLLLKLLSRVRETSAAVNNGLATGNGTRWHGHEEEEQGQSNEKSQHVLPRSKKAS